VRLSRQSDRIDYDIPVKMGDKQTEDVWYPYVFVESGADDRGRRFQIKQGKFADRWLVHASQLRPVDQVRVMPSLFSYIFLEHSAQRFEFDAQRDVMYLGDLSRLAAMWTGIRQTPQMTDTKLRNVAGLLQEKELWRYESPDEFRHLAETTLKTAGLWNTSGGAVTPDDVISRRFERCLDLYLHILKQRVKGEKNG
jgi:hypothetical protein